MSSNVSGSSRSLHRSHGCPRWRFVATLLAGTCLSIATSGAQPSSDPRDAAAGHADEPIWSVDPGAPGPDIPPVGHSLFDSLLARSARANAAAGVPFPFRLLLSRLADTRSRDASGQSSLRAVLIPLGRSLQRNAAAPAYFESPRLVVAVDAAPRATAEGSPLQLRDRLYLGYQPRANVIEVISYNEAMGRFEFQVVSDYRADGSGRVGYARRAVCMACHQNGGPIFSRGVWSETNANPRVAAALRSAQERFEGIEVERGVDVPAAIDASVRRANRLAAYQWLWRNGCAAQDASEPAVRCRAQAAIAALQYRLSGGQSYDETAPAFRDSVVGAMAALTKTQRGAGLALPDPGIANRDPLQELASNAPLDTDYRSAANVTAEYDPLSPRPPLEMWSWTEPGLLARRLVAGLSEFLSDSDARRLDADLLRGALAHKASRRHSGFDCDIGTAQLTRTRRRVAFVCVAPVAPLQPSGRLEGSLVADESRIESGSIDHMTFAEAGAGAGVLRNIAIVGGSIGTAHSHVVATFRIARDGMHVRRGDGNAVEGIRLEWYATAPRADVNPGRPRGARGGAVVTIVEDFAPVLAAVGALERDTLKGTSDALSAQPFRRASILLALGRAGFSPGQWCCLDDGTIPVPATAETMPVALGKATPRSDFEIAFHRHCALCHRSSEPVPPNFLAGTQQQVLSNLAHCAQRLYVRLAMWDHPAEGRAKTPMPPFTALRGAGISESEWQASSDLAAMRGHVAKILQQEQGRFESPAALLRTNYEHLRTCLP